MKYHSFTCSTDDLTERLNDLSADGWRLLTCQVTPSHGVIASGIPNATVIMEKLEHTEEEDTAEEPQAEAMPMKG